GRPRHIVGSSRQSILWRNRRPGMKTVLSTAVLAVLVSALAAHVADTDPRRPGDSRASSLPPTTTELLAGTPVVSASPQVLTAATQRLALASVHAEAPRRAPVLAFEALDEVVQRTCAGCHSERRKSGNLSLDGFTVAGVAQMPET